MKKLTVLLAIIFIVMSYGCSPKLFPRIVNTYYADYSKYADEGFLISPDIYSGQYEACGEILIEVYPADVEAKRAQNNRKIDATYEQSGKMYSKEIINFSELLDIAVKKAKSVGADALVNFKCSVIKNTYYTGGISYSKLSHYEITGFAIKRK